jgi:hypothetical protein
LFCYKNAEYFWKDAKYGGNFRQYIQQVQTTRANDTCLTKMKTKGIPIN